MKENILKSMVRKCFFPNGAIRRIQFGPLRGKLYRVSDTTRMETWYSGHEHDHHRAFARLVRAGDVCMDVGANWGVHTLYLSSLVGERGLVAAIEPLPQTVEELRYHVQLNGCGNVKIFPCALDTAPGEVPFILTGSTKTAHFARDGETRAAVRNQITVKTRTLDSIVAELGLRTLRLAKIDVEGAESRVILGAQRTIKEFKPILIIDLHTPEQDVAVARLLTGFDYKLEGVGGRQITNTEKGWPEPNGVWGTILALPR